MDAVTHESHKLSFASDNYAGVHPEVLDALAAVSAGHQVSYGDDEVTTALAVEVKRHFGEAAECYPVFNGTGANVTALQAMTERWGAVICAASAHINTDEAGAPEKVGGLKLLAVPTASTPDGKLTPELIEQQATRLGDVHAAQPEVVSITQSTELGTVYSVQELRALVDRSHELGLRVHMDGARLANAAASLGVSLGAVTSEVGVDVLSFGGTKNGLMLGEAVIVLNPDAVRGVDYLRKMNMQLASKMRFISVQLLTLLEGDLWLRNAEHANAMAARLRVGLEAALASGQLSGVGFSTPTQANSIFATLPDGAADRLREFAHFYDWDAAKNEVRWMCAFDTTEAEVDRFLGNIIDVVG